MNELIEQAINKYEKDIKENLNYLKQTVKRVEIDNRNDYFKSGVSVYFNSLIKQKSFSFIQERINIRFVFLGNGEHYTLLYKEITMERLAEIHKEEEVKDEGKEIEKRIIDLLNKQNLAFLFMQEPIIAMEIESVSFKGHSKTTTLLDN